MSHYTRFTVLVVLVLLVSGCGDTTESSNDHCIDTLEAQPCPVGSTVEVEVGPCEGIPGDGLLEVDGTTTTLCQASGENCVQRCELTQPCLCGVSSRDDTLIVCAECVPQCGDALCQPGEESCEEDCGLRCTPGDERCWGATRQVCQASGRWEEIPCDGAFLCQEEDTTTSCVACDTSSPPTWYVDRDGDGFGSAQGATLETCSPPARFVLDSSDCDDRNVHLNTQPGCEPLQNDVCEPACHASQTCESGTCVCHEGADCNGDAADGCEVDLNANPQHCGACSNPCAERAFCAVGVCRDGDIPLVVAGGAHSCAVRQGQVWCWGRNDSGQLGDETTTDSAVPVPVEALSDVIGIDAGLAHSCALLQGGSVSCWGRNDWGQLGDGTNTERQVPVPVSGLSDVLRLSLGDHHACALREGGAVSCWGLNDKAQLGTGPTGSPYHKTLPVDIFTGGIVDISGGAKHTCAVHEDGTISCWGANAAGQVGSGSLKGMVPEGEKAVGISDAVSVSCGSLHTCALHSDGTVSCWGLGRLLGYGFPDHSRVPVDVLNLANAIAISAGTEHTCAVREDGRATCWGDNRDGRLGNGTASLTHILEPVAVAGTSGVLSISAGGEHTCALLERGVVSCWGSNLSGQAGNGLNAGSPKPFPVAGLSEVTEIDAGGLHACAVQRDGKVLCWGRAHNGLLLASPEAVPGIENATDTSSGQQHSCVLRDDGTVSCWGQNLGGKLGDGTTTDRSTPVDATGVSDAIGLAVGLHHSCVLHQDGTVSCWGDNTGPDASAQHVPTLVPGISNAVHLSAGVGFRCAVLATGSLMCWGQRTTNPGLFGDELSSESYLAEPVVVTGISDAIRVAAGYFHICVLHASGTVSCWGYNEWGQAGAEPSVNQVDPVSIPGLSNVVDLAGSHGHTCAVHEAGTLSCWGDNASGQLGADAEPIAYSAPLEVFNIKEGARSISAGYAFSCAVVFDDVACWGDNVNGQLGDGSGLRTVPAVVDGLPSL